MIGGFASGGFASGGFALRLAGPADVDAIMALETATFENDAWSRSMMLADLSQEHCLYLLATDPAIPGLSGYAGLMSPRGSADADIQTIAVAPAARRRGLGRLMMETLIAEALTRRARRVFLEVRADNPGAQTLYESLGFLRIGTRRGYYQPDNVDAVSMRLDLTAAGRDARHLAGEDPLSKDPLSKDLKVGDQTAGGVA